MNDTPHSPGAPHHVDKQPKPKRTPINRYWVGVRAAQTLTVAVVGYALVTWLAWFARWTVASWKDPCVVTYDGVHDICCASSMGGRAVSSICIGIMGVFAVAWCATDGQKVWAAWKQKAGIK